MLKKDTLEMAAKSNRVKKTVAMGLIAAMTTLAPATSHALEIVTSEYKLTFKRAELMAPEGVESVYSRMEKKAKMACGMGRSINDAGQEISREECIADILEQFVTTSEVEDLMTYHAEQTKKAG
ncbi:UrcA family protein [Litorimonas taeanensis]|uniref:UrcA family protein n=1 Tax=Litorimonas taeanensis TaxID=568099 RepID=A0A420WLP9_9PROT|nr:UrcA family protein [Litorimonas taeanensis]RKQ71842.1 UrcA family protein [Litorimonas taeanensis]